MLATVEAIVRRLDAGDGLLYRYLPDASPDGLSGHEGAFLLCSFWLADNLAHQGRLDQAQELHESLCSRAGPLGLLPEEIAPQGRGSAAGLMHAGGNVEVTPCGDESDDDEGEAEAGGIGDDSAHDGSHGKAGIAPKASNAGAASPPRGMGDVGVTG